MNLDTYSRAQVARFCIEVAAHYGGVNDMLCIAFVLRNRVAAGWGNWLDVLADAPAKSGSAPPGQAPDIRTSNVRSFLQKVEAVISGEDQEDMTNGALFYTDMNQPQREWFQANILDNQQDHRRCAQAPPLLFFQ